jgi:hypothetical protein
MSFQFLAPAELTEHVVSAAEDVLLVGRMKILLLGTGSFRSTI